MKLKRFISRYLFYLMTFLLFCLADSAFNGCTGLKTIYIPETVTSIGASTFANCSNLETVAEVDQNKMATAARK